MRAALLGPVLALVWVGVGAPSVLAGGFWHTPSTFRQCVGCGFGPGYHAPMRMTPPWNASAERPGIHFTPTALPYDQPPYGRAAHAVTGWHDPSPEPQGSAWRAGPVGGPISGGPYSGGPSPTLADPEHSLFAPPSAPTPAAERNAPTGGRRPAREPSPGRPDPELSPSDALAPEVIPLPE